MNDQEKIAALEQKNILLSASLRQADAEIEASKGAHSNHPEGQSEADGLPELPATLITVKRLDETDCPAYTPNQMRLYGQLCRDTAPAARAPAQHDSDCSTHNMPAYSAGPCDCSVAADSAPTEAEALRAVLAVKQAELDDWIHTNKIDELQREVLALRSASAPIGDMQAGEREAPFWLTVKGEGAQVWLNFKGGTICLNNIAEDLGPITRRNMQTAISAALTAPANADSIERLLGDNERLKEALSDCRIHWKDACERVEELEAAQPAAASGEAVDYKLAADEKIFYSRIGQSSDGLPFMTDSDAHGVWDIAMVFKTSHKRLHKVFLEPFYAAQPATQAPSTQQSAEAVTWDDAQRFADDYSEIRGEDGEGRDAIYALTDHDKWVCYNFMVELFESVEPRIAARPALVDEQARDAARFQWLCEDHDSVEVRTARDQLLENFGIRSLSANRMNIDAARAAIAHSTAAITKEPK